MSGGCENQNNYLPEDYHYQIFQQMELTSESSCKKKVNIFEVKISLRRMINHIIIEIITAFSMLLEDDQQTGFLNCPI